MNPLGDEAIGRIGQWWTPGVCSCEGAWDTTGQAPDAALSRHTRTQGLSPEELEAKRAARRGGPGPGEEQATGAGRPVPSGPALSTASTAPDEEK